MTTTVDVMHKALRDIAEGCSFPSDDVQRAIRDRARAALCEAEALAQPQQPSGTPVAYVHLVPDQFSQSYDVRFWTPVPIGTKLYTHPAEHQKCKTCNGHGMIGGPSYYEPGEGGVPCPDCAEQQEGGDTAMLDWLESQINEHGAIHLHDGNHPSGHGLGLRPGRMARTLRQAIRAAMTGDNGNG